MESLSSRSRFGDVSAQASELLSLGESAAVEFKRDADAVHPRTLAALANWITLSDEYEVAYLLVGVEEITDEDGRTFGRPRALSKGLDRTVARLQDVTAATYPIPVNVHLVEEGVNTSAPFVRVEVRPSTAPHYDGEGRRQTRQGRSTRPLSDEELLSMYLARESGAFAVRFRQIGAELQAAVGSVGENIDQIGKAIEATVAQPLAQLTTSAEEAASSADGAAAAAMSAESSAEAAARDVQQVEMMLRDVQDLVADLTDESPEALAARVVDKRRLVWWAFTEDTWTRTSRLASSLEARLRSLLSMDVSLSDTENAWELRLWSDLMDDRADLRERRVTLKWWDEALKSVAWYREKPAYGAPELPDLRAELRADVDGALDDAQSLTRQFSALLPGVPN